MLLLSLAMGFVVGLLVWAVLTLSNQLVFLLWDVAGKRTAEGFAAEEGPPMAARPAPAPQGLMHICFATCNAEASRRSVV